MKTSELREQTVAELEEQESKLSRELWKTRMDNYTNKLDDTAKIRRLRRDIARVKTILTQKKQG
jgi:large subunit ribosomal protein L29